MTDAAHSTSYGTPPAEHFDCVPNMAWVFGYFRASWTLRADLVADFVCRLLTRQIGDNG